MYGWVLLLVIQTGGMAAVAVTFARYFLELSGWALNDSLVAALALTVLTAINCVGVRAGSRVQSAMTLTAVGAIAVVVVSSLFVVHQVDAQTATVSPTNPLLAFGAAMTPILFAYGGWQTTSFLAGEVRDPRKTLPRGLILGVLGVIAVYTSVNFAYLRGLGAAGLATTSTPASALMHMVFGAAGARFIAAGIAFSAFGFLAQSMLTAPRVYFAMAEDGVFFRSVAWVHPRTRVPMVAIALQGVCAIIIALSGTYAQVVNYVVAMDSIFFGLTACCLFVLRKRAVVAGVGDRGGKQLSTSVTSGVSDPGYNVPFHPWTTLLFIAAEWLIVASTFAHDPIRSSIGLGIALAGLPAFLLWRRSS
jgi:APA family basic amino acid/polyamine antiporter